MASPRFTGNGFSNPLNPIGLHAENQYRELNPLGADFQIYGAENKVFALEVVSDVVKAGIKATAKNAFNLAAKAFPDDKIFAETIQESVEKALLKSAKESVEAGAKDGGAAAVKKAISKGGKEGAESAYLKGGVAAFKQGAGEGAEAAVKGSAKDVVQGGFRNRLKSMGKSFGMGTVKVGASLVVPLGLVFFLNTAGADALADWVANATGMNCDEKAIDAGYIEGEDDYKEFVTDCQKDGMNLMTMITAGVVVIGGVIIYSFVK